MELETNEFLGALGETIARLNSAASLLERTAACLEQREASMVGDVQKIVAAVEQGAEVSQRELELERKLALAEQQIAEFRAEASNGSANGSSRAASVRKTLPTATIQLLAKQGISTLESIEAGALDAALASLSLEQRIAVKSQLLRAGALA